MAQSSSISIKLILLCLLFLFLLFLITRSSFSSSQSNPSSIIAPETHVSNLSCGPSLAAAAASNSTSTSIPTPTPSSCTKTPPSLTQALVHYATTNTTPQQTYNEISVTLRVLQKKSPCNFLVFGLGHDSLMWASLNHGGRTVFLEENKGWIQQIKQKLPTLESYHVTYETKVHQAQELMETGMKAEECKVVTDPRSSKCSLAHKGFPADVYDSVWDLIMVDAPTGYHDQAPGRMTAIYTAGLMARNREVEGETDVFVHDVNRVAEDKFSRAFLCEGYLTEQEGLLRHFTIPTHRTRQGIPFCP